MREINNLIFEGGGILGISYLGALDYLYHNDKMKNLERVGGTSAGAITACITAFNLPFREMTEIANSLDYNKVPSKSDISAINVIPNEVKKVIEDLFGDINCLYRMMTQYGWYSTEYFYKWIKGVIHNQFESTKKRPPYTFEDFKDPSLHKNNRPFLDLYIVGTNLTMKTASIFSYETTPSMEVAEAIRISMSIPLFFEAIISDDHNISGNAMTNVLCDGGAINNYPLALFDYPKYNPNLYYGINMDTLGIRFHNNLTYQPIDNLISYIEGLLHLYSYVQNGVYESNPLNKERSIVIDTLDVSPLDFNIKTNDDTYHFLYNQGYDASKNYFDSRRVP